MDIFCGYQLEVDWPNLVALFHSQLTILDSFIIVVLLKVFSSTVCLSVAAQLFASVAAQLFAFLFSVVLDSLRTGNALRTMTCYVLCVRGLATCSAASRSAASGPLRRSHSQQAARSASVSGVGKGSSTPGQAAPHAAGEPAADYMRVLFARNIDVG